MKICIIPCFTFLLILAGCFQGDGGFDCGSNTAVLSYIGELELNETGRSFLYAGDTSGSVTFINSNGFETTFSLQGSLSVKVKEAVYSYQKEDKRCGTVTFSKICNSSKDTYILTSPDLHFPMKVIRSTPFVSSDKDTVTLRNLSDRGETIEFYFNKLLCSGDLKDTVKYNKPKVTLNGNEFYNVYEFENKALSGIIFIKRFFIESGRGLIGFELSNNELWSVKR